MHEKRARDRRVQRTEALLRGALSALVREKPYEEIAVKEILHRANVGRSTFYTHFCDKDELLRSCIHGMLRTPESARPRPAPATDHENILAFAFPIFDHIERHRRAGQPTVGPSSRETMHEHLQYAITELIEAEVRVAFDRSGRRAGHVSPELLARWIASTFVLVLDWWVESEAPLSAGEADKVFRAIAEPSLAAALGRGA